MDAHSGQKNTHSGRYVIDLVFTSVCLFIIMYFNVALG